MFRKPSLQVSPPPPQQPNETPQSRFSVASDPSQKDSSWIKRTIGRATSQSYLDHSTTAGDLASSRLAVPDGDAATGLGSRNASSASLSSQYTGEYAPPEDPAPSAPRVTRPSNATTTGTRDHVRTHKDSVASSAFLSVSPAHTPSGSNAPPTTPLTSLYLVSGLPKVMLVLHIFMIAEIQFDPAGSSSLLIHGPWPTPTPLLVFTIAKEL